MKNKWIILVAAIVLQTILGGIYAWSVFIPPLREIYHLTAGQTGMIIGIAFATFAFSMVFAGQLLEARGPRLTASIGALLYAAGYLTASFSGGSYLIILLGIGILMGTGIGFGYVCPLSTCMRWFPKNKGMISGVAVAGFGGGAIVVTKLATMMFAGGLDVLTVFRWLGITLGIPALIAALLLQNPDDEEQHHSEAETMKEPLMKILFRREVILLFTGMFAGTFGGLMVIGNLKPIGLSSGQLESYATLGISVLAIGNVMGRITWGTIIDKIGTIAIPLSLLMLGLAAVLFLVPSSPMIFLAAAVLTGFSFGSCFVLYATETAHLFGPSAVGRIYPYIYLAYGVSGIIGPSAGGWIYEISGSYTGAILMAIALAWTCATVIWLMSGSKQKSFLLFNVFKADKDI